ncbi:MAG TPA: hypothetical protein VEQ37_07420 [Actinomycetota bacterium]|nr:hypothetical protein [Actinomycetota bacterium]
MPRLQVTLREVEVDFRPTPVRGDGPFFVKPEVPSAELRGPHLEGDDVPRGSDLMPALRG